MSILQFIEVMAWNVAIPVTVCGTLYCVCWIKAKLAGEL